MPEQLALARVRRGRHVGLLTDAFVLDAFAYAIVGLMRDSATLASDDGEIRFMPTEALRGVDVGTEPRCAACRASSRTARWCCRTPW